MITLNDEKVYPPAELSRAFNDTLISFYDSVNSLSNSIQHNPDINICISLDHLSMNIDNLHKIKTLATIKLRELTGSSDSCFSSTNMVIFANVVDKTMGLITSIYLLYITLSTKDNDNDEIATIAIWVSLLFSKIRDWMTYHTDKVGKLEKDLTMISSSDLLISQCVQIRCAFESLQDVYDNRQSCNNNVRATLRMLRKLPQTIEVESVISRRQSKKSSFNKKDLITLVKNKCQDEHLESIPSEDVEALAFQKKNYNKKYSVEELLQRNDVQDPSMVDISIYYYNSYRIYHQEMDKLANLLESCQQSAITRYNAIAKNLDNNKLMIVNLRISKNYLITQKKKMEFILAVVDRIASAFQGDAHSYSKQKSLVVLSTIQSTFDILAGGTYTLEWADVIGHTTQSFLETTLPFMFYICGHMLSWFNGWITHRLTKDVSMEKSISKLKKYNYSLNTLNNMISLLTLISQEIKNRRLTFDKQISMEIDQLQSDLPHSINRSFHRQKLKAWKLQHQQTIEEVDVEPNDHILCNESSNPLDMIREDCNKEDNEMSLMNVSYATVSE